MTESGKKQRVCIIGAGPCGLCCLYHMKKKADEGKSVPDVVCYDKNDTYGGLWNYSWRTGLDQFGEVCHFGQYRHLWSNGPKECLEFPDYTWWDHFGHTISSFPPREVLRDYLKGRFEEKENVIRSIKFKTVVQQVTYDEDNDEFVVIVKDLEADKDLQPERFSHVIVATGHFNFPNVPYFKGMETFPGRVMHSHDFRDAREFEGKRVLVVGSSYSADDMALQCMKFGGKSVICSWRTNPMNFNFPKGVEERELLTEVQGNTVFFKNGSSAEVDAIILATGYKYHFPFMKGDIQLKNDLLNSLYPADLYKGLLWMKGGNNKVFYMGMQDQYYSYSMFDVQAEWVCRVILGENKLPNRTQIQDDINLWLDKVPKQKDCFGDIAVQTEYVEDLRKAVDRTQTLDVRKHFDEWETHRKHNICTYRDQVFRSIFTNHMAHKNRVPWFADKDDSLKSFKDRNHERFKTN